MSTLIPLNKIESIGGELIPAGVEFDAKCIEVKPAKTDLSQDGSSGGKLHVQTKYRVLDGEYEGLEFTKWHWVTVTKSAKNGKFYAPGATELMDSMKKLGKPLPEGFGFPLKGEETEEHMKSLAKALAERLNPNVTPRIRFKTIGKQVEKKDATGKYVPAFNEDGSKQMRVEYVLLGPGGSAAGKANTNTNAADLGAPGRETVASTDADPLSFG